MDKKQKRGIQAI